MMLDITFMCFFAICVSSLVNVYSNILPLLSCSLALDWFIILNWPLELGRKSHQCSLVFCIPQSFPLFFCVCSYFYDSYINKYALPV